MRRERYYVFVMFPFARFLRGKDAHDPEARERAGRKLDRERKHLRAQLAENQRALRKLWTDYRASDERAEKKTLKRRINHHEAERKDLVKRMLKVQTEMKKLGYQAAAGTVEMH